MAYMLQLSGYDGYRAERHEDGLLSNAAPLAESAAIDDQVPETSTVLPSGDPPLKVASVGPGSGSDPDALLNFWLRWQCRIIAGVQFAAIFNVSERDSNWPVAFFAEAGAETQADVQQVKVRKSLQRLASIVVSNDRSVVHQQQNNAASEEGVSDVLALKLKADDQRYVVCLYLAPRSESQLGIVRQLLLWGSAWLSQAPPMTTDPASAGAASPAHSTTPSTTPNGVAQQQWLADIIKAESVYAGCANLVNSLAKHFDCDRVSISIKSGLAVRLAAISQLSEFDRKQQLVRSLEAAMEECLDQQAILCIPATDSLDAAMLKAHRQLASENRGAALCSIPVSNGDQVVGAVLLERKDTRPFSSSEQIKYSELLTSVAPALSLLIQGHEQTSSRAFRKIQSRFNQLMKPQSLQQRWRTVVASAALVVALLFPVTHHVSATAAVEGADKQVLVSPQAGYVKSAHFRAGDHVTAGDVIATLDDSDLLIDRDKWRGELNKWGTSYSDALASRDRTQIGLLQARKQQIVAELDLVEHQLERTVLRAPFNGVLVSGDLNQSLGAAVETGQTLFEIASLDEFRLVLSVAEQDVAAIEPGQVSQLRLSALPGQTYSATIETMMPVAVNEEKRSVFHLKAKLDESDELLKPGMRGVAKIATDRDPLIWVFVHPLFEKISLWIWSLW